MVDAIGGGQTPAPWRKHCTTTVPGHTCVAGSMLMPNNANGPRRPIPLRNSFVRPHQTSALERGVLVADLANPRSLVLAILDIARSEPRYAVDAEVSLSAALGPWMDEQPTSTEPALHTHQREISVGAVVPGSRHYGTDRASSEASADEVLEHNSAPPTVARCEQAIDLPTPGRERAAAGVSS